MTRREKYQFMCEKIGEMFQLQYNYKEICIMLLALYAINLSERTLRRIVKCMNLRRKNIVESSIGSVLAALLIEINSCGFNLGYRSLRRRLRKNYGFQVKQVTVLYLLRIIDPHGVEARKRYRLNRRRYNVAGPNYLWHIDGYDRLKPFGMAINGCVDGFSRKIIYLRVSTTNNKPQVIAHYFLQAVKEFKCIPSMIRTDMGTENTVIDILQMALRTDHADED